MSQETTKEESFFEKGQRDCRAYYNSQAYAGLTRFVKAEEAIKLFWPPVDEMQIMVSTPLPKPRQKWIAGFKKEQKNGSLLLTR